MRCTLSSQITIDAADIVRCLQDFALGDDPDAMSDAEVASSLAMLNAVLPDLAGAEVEVSMCVGHVH